MFKCPYKLSEYERIGVQARCDKLLNVDLVDLSNVESTCTMVMPQNNYW